MTMEHQDKENKQTYTDATAPEVLHKAPRTHRRSTRNNKPGILSAIKPPALTAQEPLQEIANQIDNIQTTSPQGALEIHSPAPPQRVAPHGNPTRIEVESIITKN